MVEDAAAQRILVVDDDVALRELVTSYLGASGYQVKGVGDGAAFRASMAQHGADLVVLDLMLPGEDGLSLLKWLRTDGGPPVIIVSARGEEVDRVVGLEVGADDYLAKPFGPRELLARVRAVLRRGGANPAAPKEAEALAFGPFRLDVASHVLLHDGAEIPLTSGEFTLLRIFLEHPNQVLTRDHLITLVKGYERAPFDRSVDVRVTRLRRKIEPNPEAPVFLRTNWGEGYLFSPRGVSAAVRKPSRSLFRHTAFTIAAGLLVFQLASGAAIFFNLMRPLAQRSADDMAALLVLSARTWVELPAVTRPAFEAELLLSHHMEMSAVQAPLGDEVGHHPYLNFLRESLTTRLDPGASLHVTESADGRFHADIPMAGRVLRFSFDKALITPRPSLALAWSAVAGLLVTLILAWLLARRITAPVARLTEAARQIGSGERPPRLPESGEHELAELARIFNQTAAQLAERRENQSTLLAGVSHDLRTPLARLKMALGMLAEERESPLLVRMERDVGEMETLIGAQLELARAQEREAVEYFDIDAMLIDLIEATEAQSPGQTHLRASGPACHAAVAPLALRRILGNLLENALRYGGPGRLELVRRCCKGAILIGVRDRGPGIPAALRDAVFRPFFRVDPSRNRSTGGSGLGLAIARQLAETQGWNVALKPRVGGGTSAWLAIPLN